MPFLQIAVSSLRRSKKTDLRRGGHVEVKLYTMDSNLRNGVQ